MQIRSKQKLDTGREIIKQKKKTLVTSSSCNVNRVGQVVNN